MGLLTPEEALAQYRAYDPASGDTARGDFLANELFANYGVDQEYGTKGYKAGGMLSPQEQMQIEWMRSNLGQNSGNNKDDRIKRIRNAYNMPNERLGEGGKDERYIVRNKIDKTGKADGMTMGDAFQIGDYTQSDTGKDDGLVQQIINKSLPGFDVGDVTSMPGIDWVAMAAAPFTGGVSTAVLEALKAAEAGEIGPDTVAAIVGAAGGWDSVLGGLKDFLPTGGASMPTWLEDAYNYGKETYDTIANNPIVQQAQDIYGQIRDFTDPLEDIFGNVTDIFGDFDLGGLDEFLPQAPQAQQVATGGYQRPERAPLELLPLEYRNAYTGPQGLINPFEAG